MNLNLNVGFLKDLRVLLNLTNGIFQTKGEIDSSVAQNMHPVQGHDDTFGDAFSSELISLLLYCLMVFYTSFLAHCHYFGQICKKNSLSNLVSVFFVKVGIFVIIDSVWLILAKEANSI